MMNGVGALPSKMNVDPTKEVVIVRLKLHHRLSVPGDTIPLFGYIGYQEPGNSVFRFDKSSEERVEPTSQIPQLVQNILFERLDGQFPHEALKRASDYINVVPPIVIHPDFFSGIKGSLEGVDTSKGARHPVETNLGQTYENTVKS